MVQTTNFGLPTDGMDLRHPLQQQRRQQVVEIPAGEARSALEGSMDGMGWDIWHIWYMDIYIYGINMEADDELIFYKYDAKATKYGDLLFFLEDVYYVC